MRYKLLLLVSIFCFPTFLFSQNFNNPYSAYGIGELQNIEFSHLSAMEPLGLTHQRQSSYSLQNPASYAPLDFTTFNIGLAGKLYQMSGQNTSFQDNRVSFGYLSMGFPIMKDVNWAASFGLVPVSQVGYQYTERPQGYNDYTINSTGQGGLSKFYIGTAIEVLNNLNIGLNAAYLFGNKDNFTTYQFDLDENFLSSRKIIDESIGGFIFDGGLQYNQSLSEDVDLIFGASGRMPTSVDFNRGEEVFVYPRSQASSLGAQLRQGRADTVDIKDFNGSMQYPGKYQATIELRNAESWRLGVGVQYGEWSQLAILDQNQGLADNYEIDLAGEITPSSEGTSYWGRMDYRLGIKYAEGYLNPVGEPLKQYEASIGFGFPLFRKSATTGRGQESSVDFSLALGTLGNKDGELLKQNYLKFKLGFNLTENWFIEQKIK